MWIRRADIDLSESPHTKPASESVGILSVIETWRLWRLVPRWISPAQSCTMGTIWVGPLWWLGSFAPVHRFIPCTYVVALLPTCSRASCFCPLLSQPFSLRYSAGTPTLRARYICPLAQCLGIVSPSQHLRVSACIKSWTRTKVSQPTAPDEAPPCRFARFEPTTLHDLETTT